MAFHLLGLVELTCQWGRILAIGPLHPVTFGDFNMVQGVGIGEFHRIVFDLHRRLSDFIHAVVVHRRDEAVRGWRNWVREDPLIHPKKWLRLDLVPPAPFLQCDAHLTPFGSGGSWLPLLPEVALPRLTGQMLADVVQRKGATAGCLDGWGWRELKVLPVAWFHSLARILAKVEEFGVWPDGLLYAYITMIPKVDGDATPLGQRPLSVLPVVYRIWASARMVQLEPWFRLFLVLGVGVVLFKLGLLRRLILRRSYPVLLRVMFIFLLLTLLSLSILLIGVFWIVCLVVWVCLVGFGIRILSFIHWFVCGLNLLLG